MEFKCIFSLLICSIAAYGQLPNSYYASAENKSAQELKAALHDIIDDHQAYNYSSYTRTILKQSDADPNNPNNILLIYTGESIVGNNHSQWNREHVWAKSRGDFGTSTGAGSDVHNLRASNIQVNSDRSNHSFDNCNSGCTTTWNNKFKRIGDHGIFEPRDQDKGDVARIIFYMTVRYEGDVTGEPNLEMINTTQAWYKKTPYHGIRSTLLAWHNQDPVDDFERNRNNVIYQYQGNRNPFIDHPELADYLWGNNEQEIWNSTASMSKVESWQASVSSNPVRNEQFTISSSFPIDSAAVFSLSGALIQYYPKPQKQYHLNASSGIYVLKIQSGKRQKHMKLVF